MPDLQSQLNRGPTGEHQFGQTKTITYPFRGFILKIMTTLDGKFVGVSEISARKEFLDHQQKLRAAKSHDLEPFYKDEDG